MEPEGIKDEFNEEMDKISRMSSFDRLSYIRNLIKFYKQIEEYETDTIKDLFDRLMLITRGY